MISFFINKLSRWFFNIGNSYHNGQKRITKRGEIWKGNLKEGLKIMYHKGTIVIPEKNY